MFWPSALKSLWSLNRNASACPPTTKKNACTASKKACVLNWRSTVQTPRVLDQFLLRCSPPENPSLTVVEKDGPPDARNPICFGNSHSKKLIVDHHSFSPAWKRS